RGQERAGLHRGEHEADQRLTVQQHQRGARGGTMNDLRMIFLASLAVALLTSGCAGSMGTMRAGPSVPAADAAADAATAPVTPFDGSYRVTLRSTGAATAAGTTSWCASPGQPTIAVSNGQFSYAVPHPNVPGNATPVYSA